MATPYLVLWCDPTQNKIYSGWQKNTQALTPVLKQGDNVGVEIHWVQANSLTSGMQEILFPPAATIRVAVGRLDALPSGGTFTLTYGATTTDSFSYDILASDLQTALNEIPEIIAEGGVNVSKIGTQYRIVWNEVGTLTNTLTADVDMLYPTSQASISITRIGDLTASRIILFKLKQSAIAATSTFVPIEEPAITSTVLFASTWRVKVYPNPKDGVWAITVVQGANTYKTESLSSDATGDDVAGALDALNVVTGQLFSVIKSGDYTWDISAPSAVDSITVTSGLVGYSAMYGVLNMNTAEVDEFLAGGASGTAKIEVQVDMNGEIQTIAQNNVTVINDLIDESSFNIVTRESLMPVESVVRYDTSQALTEPQKETARLNIGAVSLSEVSSTLNLTNLPTTNEKNAMQYSVFPSDTNPFTTMSERNPFDQELNTTNNVSFNSVDSAGIVSSTISVTDLTVIEGKTITTTSAAGSLVVSPTGITFADGTTQSTASVEGAYLPLSGGTMTGIVKWGAVGAVEIASNGILFPDGTFQSTAAVSAYTTQIFLAMSDPAGARYIDLQVDSIGSQPAIRVQESGYFNYMTMNGRGLIFPDGTIQTTAGGGGGNPFDQSLNTTDNVAFNSIYKTDPSKGSYLLTLSGGNNTPVARVTNTSGSGTEMNVNGITFPDGTTQTTAGGGGTSIISPTGAGALQHPIAIWNDTGWTNSWDAGGFGGTLFRYNLGVLDPFDMICRFGPNEGSGPVGSMANVPAIKISMGFDPITGLPEEKWMELRSDGLKFPDGSWQTSAGYSNIKNLSSYNWESYVVANGVTTERGEVKSASAYPNLGKATYSLYLEPFDSYVKRFTISLKVEAAVGSQTDSENKWGFGLYKPVLDNVPTEVIPDIGFYWTPATGAGSTDAHMNFTYPKLDGTQAIIDMSTESYTFAFPSNVRLVFNSSAENQVDVYIGVTLVYTFYDIKLSSVIGTAFYFGIGAKASVSNGADVDIWNCFISE